MGYGQGGQILNKKIFMLLVVSLAILGMASVAFCSWAGCFPSWSGGSSSSYSSNSYSPYYGYSDSYGYGSSGQYGYQTQSPTRKPAKKAKSKNPTNK